MEILSCSWPKIIRTTEDSDYRNPNYRCPDYRGTTPSHYFCSSLIYTITVGNVLNH